MWQSLEVAQCDAVLVVSFRSWCLGRVLAAQTVLEDIASGLESISKTQVVSSSLQAGGLELKILWARA
ncbi:MAG: hypothetical protein AAF708_07030 [Deinococcota bacterium]